MTEHEGGLLDLMETGVPTRRRRGFRGLVAPGSRRVGLLSLHRGRYQRATLLRSTLSPGRMALDATLRSFAARLARWGGWWPAQRPDVQDLRLKLHRSPNRLTVAFVLDNSFSMHAASVMEVAARTVAGMMSDACRRRDRVTVVAFGGIRQPRGHVYYGPGRNFQAALQTIRRLPVAGRTPLASGIEKALRVLRQERYRQRGSVPFLVVVSDFQPNVGVSASSDPESDVIAYGALARRLGVQVIVVHVGGDPPGVALRFAWEAKGTLLGLEELLEERDAGGQL